MPRETWPPAIRLACFDTWQDEVYVPGREEEVDAIAERWGGFDIDALERMAHRGNATERLFALFALGHLVPPVDEALLTPFLTSPERKERWISAIGLGRQRNEHSFAILLNLLLEEIEYCSPFPRETLDRVEEARNLASDNWNWQPQADSAIVEIWQHEQACQEDYRWYTVQRITITGLLYEWRNPRTIQHLRHTLAVCEEIEQRPDFDDIPVNALIGWSTFLDDLRKTICHLEP